MCVQVKHAYIPVDTRVYDRSGCMPGPSNIMEQNKWR